MMEKKENNKNQTKRENKTTKQRRQPEESLPLTKLSEKSGQLLQKPSCGTLG
jgi:hypothetical protein